MTTDEQIRDCESTVAQIRRNIADLQSRRDELLRRIEGLKRAIGEIGGCRDIPGFRLRILELEGECALLRKSWSRADPSWKGFGTFCMPRNSSAGTIAGIAARTHQARMICER